MRLPTDIVLLLSAFNECGLSDEERARMRRVIAANEKVFRTVREGMIGHGQGRAAQAIDALLAEHLPANSPDAGPVASAPQAPASAIRLVKSAA